MTREEFWSSPVGIIFIGLIVGVIVILIGRGVIAAVRRGLEGKPNGAGQQKPVRAFPVNAKPGSGVKNLSYPDDGK